MRQIALLLTPRFLTAKNGTFSRHGTGGIAKITVFGLLGLGIWTAIFLVSLRVLGYLRGIPEVGDIVAFKLLSMLLLTAFALLMFSSILTALSRLYLSRDLQLVHTLPVPAHTIFLARWIDSTFESAWMVLVYTLPVFLAYGIAFDGSPFYYLGMGLNLLSLSVVASAVGALVVMAGVMIIPANRMKSIFIFLGLLVFVVLYLAFRLLRPELLVDPDVFITAMVYMKNLQAPASPFLPSTWAFDSLRESLSGSAPAALFHLILSWVFAALLVLGMVVLADLLYYGGFSKTQTAMTRAFKTRGRFRAPIPFLSEPLRAVAAKEIKTFLRDQAQWSQLFLIAALVVIYIYNFQALPLERVPIRTLYLQNLLAFLNMGLALFVLTAVAARFVYPAVSMESEAFWIIRTAPMTLRQFLWTKFVVYYAPLVVLTEILIVGTNLLLHVTPLMMAISTVTVFFLVPGVVALGIGFGAAYADFKAENPIQTVTSFGGVLFMTACAGVIGVILLLEAGPVYHIFMAGVREQPVGLFSRLWMAGAFLLSLAIAGCAVYLPMRFGEKRLTETQS